ncbi:phage terminase large subunit [Rhodovarius crocodyli]|uniref:phage terminase large subunit n=1 Tax=Rhodovarius crocodyli TaxID=1979269 RepID=UPI0013E30E2B|nr:phage terminase large subunit [Rhodovarius crocodyli]
MNHARLQRFRSRTASPRVKLEAQLGQESFKAFVKMAWSEVDPAVLSWNWHLDLICDEMEKAARREVREMVICIPPRSLKSQLVSVLFVAWVWTWHPAAKFITASYEMKLATRDAVKTRRLVKSDWYQARWGPASPYRGKLSTGEDHPGVAIEGDQDNKTYYETTAGGHRFCATPGGQVTGHGADFILGDDMNHVKKVEQEADREKVTSWWREAIPSRLNDQAYGVKMVIQQRTHVNDLAGECIRLGYHKVVLPMEFEADHPDRHPLDPRKVDGEVLHPARWVQRNALSRYKANLGAYAVAGQLQQRPAPRDGGIFKRHWFRIEAMAPAEVLQGGTVRRWDLAATVPKSGTDPDYTASVKMGRDQFGRVYILHANRLRETPFNVDLAIQAMASQDGNSCRLILPQDPGAAGVARMQQQQAFLAPIATEFERETGDKAERARGLASAAQAGNVILVRGEWNDAFLEELCTFPAAAHDDWLDAAAGAYSALFGGADNILQAYAQMLREAQGTDSHDPGSEHVSQGVYGGG